MTRIRRPRQIFDSWLYDSPWKQILWVVLIAIAIYGTSALIVRNVISIDKISVADESAIAQKEDDIWWTLYYFFADPGNQMSINGDLKERIVGLIMSTLGSIFLSGLLISTITNVFQRGADKWHTGFSYYKLRNHIVIIGSDQMVHGLVNQLCEKSADPIVVMTSRNVEQMRNSLSTTLKNKKNKHRVLVNYGLRDSEEYLDNINIAYAKEVYILGDTSEFDDVENFHDSLNVQCVTLIAELCKNAKRTKLPCHVLFDYKTTYHIFQYADLSPEISNRIDFYPFNFHDFWARKVLVAGYSTEENIRYKPLDYIPITDRDSKQYVHFIIIGMSKMGQAMALQAAHIAHYPNYKNCKTRITFIDRNGKMEMGEFKQKCGELFKVSNSTFIDADAWSEERVIEVENEKQQEKYTTHYRIAKEYEHLVDEGDKSGFIDVEWTFIKGDDHNSVVQQLLSNYIVDKNAITTVAVCLNLTHVSLRSAMHLPKAYYEKDIPILVQQRKTSTMVSTLNGKDLEETMRQKLLYRNIIPFGMVYDCYDLHIAASAEISKRIAAVYDYYFTYDTTPVQIDPEYANRVWDNMAISKRWSNIFAASSIPTKLRCVGIDWDMNNPCRLMDLTAQQVSMLAEIEHNRWNVEELLLGYSPVSKKQDREIDADKNQKDVLKKKFIHYDIRPYSGLKTDKYGRKANVYDEVIVKSLPIILNFNNKNL